MGAINDIVNFTKRLKDIGQKPPAGLGMNEDKVNTLYLDFLTEHFPNTFPLKDINDRVSVLNDFMYHTGLPKIYLLK